MFKKIFIIFVSISVVIFSLIGNIRYERPEKLLSLLPYSETCSQNIKYEKKCFYVIDTKLFCGKFEEVK